MSVSQEIILKNQGKRGKGPPSLERISFDVVNAEGKRIYQLPLNSDLIRSFDDDEKFRLFDGETVMNLKAPRPGRVMAEGEIGLIAIFLRIWGKYMSEDMQQDYHDKWEKRKYEEYYGMDSEYRDLSLGNLMFGAITFDRRNTEGELVFRSSYDSDLVQDLSDADKRRLMNGETVINLKAPSPDRVMAEEEVGLIVDFLRTWGMYMGREMQTNYHNRWEKKRKLLEADHKYKDLTVQHMIERAKSEVYDKGKAPIDY